jgi:hypothetical protein
MHPWDRQIVVTTTLSARVLALEDTGEEQKELLYQCNPNQSAFAWSQQLEISIRAHEHRSTISTNSTQEQGGDALCLIVNC